MMWCWRIFTALAVVIWCAAFQPAAAKQPHVVFLNPGKYEVDEGWTVNSRFMQAAADQFGIRLEILYADRDRFKMVEQARQVAARPVQPDYVVVVNEKQQGIELLQAFARSTARVLMVHNGLTPEQRAAVGSERGRQPNWIGTIVTNEADSARAVAAELFRRADGPPQVVAISGDTLTPVSRYRETGLRTYVERDGRGRLLQVVPGEWSRQDGYDKALGLLARYPEANVLWAANDLMALGALDAVRALNRQDSVVVGGMGAFPSGLQSIADGGLAVSVGGHMMVGAWAMVLLHDYHRGRDFAAADGVNLLSETIALVANQTAAARFRELTDDPSRIDYRRLSRADNPALAHYDFSYDAILRAAR